MPVRVKFFFVFSTQLVRVVSLGVSSNEFAMEVVGEAAAEPCGTPLQIAQQAVIDLQTTLAGFQQQLVVATEARLESNAELQAITVGMKAGVLSQDDADTFDAAKQHVDFVADFCSIAERACDSTTLQLRTAQHNLQALLAD